MSKRRLVARFLGLVDEVRKGGGADRSVLTDDVFEIDKEPLV